MLLRGRLLQANKTSTGFSFRSYSSLRQNQLRRSISSVVLKDNSLVTRINPTTVRLLSVSAIRWDGDPVVKEELIVELPPKPVPEASSSSELIFTLPDKPVPMDVAASLGEPSFESLGLASWWPSGRMQYFMENLHIGLGLEWYQTIAVATLCMRLLMFPVMVMAQRNMANMNNNMPAMTALQEKITDARRRGDMFEMAQLTQELQKLSEKKGINPFKNMLPIAAQVPVFLSFFVGLRGMANCPVESLSTGGILWFDNLAMTDPYYLLPFITCCTTYLQLKTGAEGAKIDMMTPKMKIAMTCMPFILFPITMNFASGITFYWMCTNIFSLTQAKIFRVPRIREALKIPKLVEHKKPPPPSGGKKKGFTESVRDTVDNFRATSQIVDRRAYDEQMFKKAGESKPIKTYKYDPTKIKRL